MPYEVPTLPEIVDRVLADIDTSMDADGSVRGNVETAVGTALSGASHLLHSSVARAARNRVPSLSEPVAMRRWASFFGIEPKPASANTGSATFVATTGTSIPAGHPLRLRDGTEFTVDTTANESGGSITVDFTATETGPEGRSDAGAAIMLGSPIAGVTTQGTVDSPGIAGGTDAESDASVYERLTDRLRNPPGGGTEADYVRWAKATVGVEVDRVWVYPNTLGPASIRVLFTVVADLSADTIPSGGQVADVQDAVDAEVPADILTLGIYAPVAQPLDMTIDGVPVSARAAVEASLEALFREVWEPGDSALISKLNEAISAAEGENDHVLTVPAANVPATSAYHLFVLGTITWT